MDQIDSFKLMRNSATLEAYRRYQREVRAVTRLWRTIALIVAFLEISLVMYGFFHHRIIHEFSLLVSLLVLVFGLSFSIAGLREWRFRRAHPFELPGTR